MPLDPTSLESHRRYLLRYALLQLRDASLAEDVVQETMLAALTHQDSFAGQSSLKTWLTSILKHKIIDLIRKRSRTTSFSDLRDPENENDLGDGLFSEDGHWQEAHRPSNWGDPEKLLAQKNFMEIFEYCTERMSATLAQVFMLREVMGLSTEEICQELSISASNCWVMLHRARMSLRLCLENKGISGI